MPASCSAPSSPHIRSRHASSRSSALRVSSSVPSSRVASRASPTRLIPTATTGVTLTSRSRAKSKSKARCSSCRRHERRRLLPLFRYQRNRHSVTMSCVSRSSLPMMDTARREPSAPIASCTPSSHWSTGSASTPRSSKPSLTSLADTVVRGVPNATRTSPAATPAASTPHRTRYGVLTGNRKAPSPAATASRWVVVRKGRLSSRAAMLPSRQAKDELDGYPVLRSAQRPGRGRRPRDRAWRSREGKRRPRWGPR